MATRGPWGAPVATEEDERQVRNRLLLAASPEEVGHRLRPPDYPQLSKLLIFIDCLKLGV